MPCDRRSACPISVALDLLGDRWTLLVIRDLAFFERSRFSEFRDAGEGIATNVLSDRLKRLTEQAIVTSRPDPADGRRVRYHLTDKGLALIPILVELAAWGARFDPDTAAPQEWTRRYLQDRQGLIDDLVERHRQVRDAP